MKIEIVYVCEAPSIKNVEDGIKTYLNLSKMEGYPIIRKAPKRFDLFVEKQDGKKIYLCSFETRDEVNEKVDAYDMELQTYLTGFQYFDMDCGVFENDSAPDVGEGDNIIIHDNLLNITYINTGPNMWEEVKE